MLGFAGGLAVALAEGGEIVDATRFACTVAGIAVTRQGMSPSMPRHEVDELIHRLLFADSKLESVETQFQP